MDEFCRLLFLTSDKERIHIKRCWTNKLGEWIYIKSLTSYYILTITIAIILSAILGVMTQKMLTTTLQSGNYN